MESTSSSLPLKKGFKRSVNAWSLADEFDKHFSFWENAPVCDLPACNYIGVKDQQQRFVVEVVVERYSMDCHRNLIEYLDEFCNDTGRMVPQVLQGSELPSVIPRLCVKETAWRDRPMPSLSEYGAVQFIELSPRSTQDARELGNVHSAYKKEREEYSKKCGICYLNAHSGWVTHDSKSGAVRQILKEPVLSDRIGNTTACFLRFAALPMCPVRLMLALAFAFMNHDIRVKLGCGDARLIKMHPDPKQDPFMLSTLLHAYRSVDEEEEEEEEEDEHEG